MAAAAAPKTRSMAAPKVNYNKRESMDMCAAPKMQMQKEMLCAEMDYEEEEKCASNGSLEYNKFDDLAYGAQENYNQMNSM